MYRVLFGICLTLSMYFFFFVQYICFVLHKSSKTYQEGGGDHFRDNFDSAFYRHEKPGNKFARFSGIYYHSLLV